jgi:hypothetical protein
MVSDLNKVFAVLSNDSEIGKAIALLDQKASGQCKALCGTILALWEAARADCEAISPR